MKKTLVVGLNLHGEIPLNKDGNPEIKYFKKKYIAKLSAVAPGVPNISTFENYNHLSDITRIHVESNPWINEPMKSDRIFKKKYKKKLEKFIGELKNKLIKENNENVKGIESEYSKHLKKKNIIEHQQNFIHNKDSLFNITELTNTDDERDYPIINKLFLKFTPEELEDLNIDESNLDHVGFNKIIIYNLENTDIFELLGPEYNHITLFNLIDLLTGMGAENIIFVDLACSLFTNHDDIPITKRAIRSLRRGLKQLNKNKTKKGGRRKSKKP